MVFLPTFTIEINQMQVYKPYMDSAWDYQTTRLPKIDIRPPGPPKITGLRGSSLATGRVGCLGWLQEMLINPAKKFRTQPCMNATNGYKWCFNILHVFLLLKSVPPLYSQMFFICIISYVPFYIGNWLW